MKDKKSKVIVISTQKGGSGKTDCSFNITAGLTDVFTNKLTCLLDIDPQHTATHLWNLDKDNSPFEVIEFNETKIINLEKEITKLSNSYDYIVIDCPPTAETDIKKSNLARLVRDAYNLADLVIIPTRLTNPDIFASEKTQSLLDEVKKINYELNARVLINKYTKNSVSTIELEPVLRVKAKFPIFQTILTHRNSHIRSTN